MPGQPCLGEGAERGAVAGVDVLAAELVRLHGGAEPVGVAPLGEHLGALQAVRVAESDVVDPDVPAAPASLTGLNAGQAAVPSL